MRTITILFGTVRYYAKRVILHAIEQHYGISYANSIQAGLDKRIAYYEANK